MPGVYRAMDAVMPRLSGSIHTSREGRSRKSQAPRVKNQGKVDTHKVNERRVTRKGLRYLHSGRYFCRLGSLGSIDSIIRGGRERKWATFGPLANLVRSPHISLDGAYTPYANGLLQEIT